MLERLDFAVKLPKFHVVTVNELSGALFRSGVVGAVQIDHSEKCPSSLTRWARYSAIGCNL